MIDLNPPPPQGWSSLHSIAYLLIGTAITDQEFEESEARRIVELMARYDGSDENQARQSFQIAHAYLAHVIQTTGREGYLQSLVKHAALLANRYDMIILRSIFQDMLAVAQADGSISDSELVYIHSAGHAWGLDGEA